MAHQGPPPPGYGHQGYEQPGYGQQGYGHPSTAPAFQQQTVVIQQPAATQAQPTAAPQNIRDFSTGLCGCCEDIGSCLCGYFCNCCLWISIASRLQESCCVPVCLQGGSFALRTKFRTMYGIRGSICNDCMAIACCPLCATCQLDREMKYMGL